jgi:hypothetical protein
MKETRMLGTCTLKPSTTKHLFCGMAALIYCPALIGVHGYSSAAEADMGALCSDWLEIAKDMHQAINAYEPEQ